MRRWIFRIFLVLFVLLVVVSGGARIILCTDLPRKWVTDYVSRELGVKVQARSLSTNLWGQTTITDLAVTVPTEDEPLLAVKQVGISHHSLPLILLSGSLGCRSVRIAGPIVTARQDETGAWNVQRLVSRLSSSNDTAQKQSKVTLPQLEIVNGTSKIVSRSGHVESIGPVSLRGIPHNSGRWDFEMYIPSQASITGKLSGAPDWTHGIKFDFKELKDITDNWIQGIPEPLRAGGRLYGHLQQNELTGKLQLDELQCGRTRARGTVGISISAAKLTVQIEELLILDAQPSIKEFKITGGSVHLDSQQVRADNVLIEAGSFYTSVAGDWNRASGQASASGSWTGEAAGLQARHAGIWSGTLSWPRSGMKQAALSLSGRAESPQSRWQGKVEITGSGKSWSDSRWQVFVPQLESHWKDTGISMQDIRAGIHANWPDVNLVNLSTPNAEHLNAQGHFSARRQDWTISIQAEGLKAGIRQASPVNFSLIAQGDPQSIKIGKLRLITETATVESGGNIALPSTELSDAYAIASWQLDTNKKQDTGKISGRLKCSAAVTGVLRPAELAVRMQISAEELNFNKKAISQLIIPCRAHIDSRSAEYEAGPFELFGGSMNLNGATIFSRQSSQVALDAEGILLQPVAELFNLPLKCQGLVKTHLQIDVPLSDLSLMTASGMWEATDMSLPPIEADTAEGRISLASGAAVFDQIRLKQDQGSATASVYFRLDQPHKVSVEAAAQKWPTILPDKALSFVTDGSAEIVLDLSKRTAAGEGNISTSVAIDQKDFGHVSTKFEARSRTVNLNDIKVELLGGIVEGMARIPLDNWLGSRIKLKWKDLKTESLAVWLPQIDGLSGSSSGSLAMAPTDDPRALEPAGIEISTGNVDAAFRDVRLGDFRISAHLGPERLVIDKSQIDLMDGTVFASGNLRFSPGRKSAYFRSDFSLLELDQLVHLLLPNAKPVAGRLSGNGMLVILSGTRGLTGRADVRLEKSDLARTTIVSTLYNATNLKFAERSPTGQGQINLRFEGSSLKIPSFVYFNRGVEIRGAANIDDLTQARSSPVTGYAIASVRPLRDIRLPGIDDLDRLMTSLQTDVSSVRILGTPAEPEIKLVAFRDVGQAFRALLWNQLSE